MGGFFHLVDLKQGTMARKIGTQKRNVHGLEAPRNSLDLPVGTYKSYYTQQDDGVHNKHQGTHDWYETGYFPAEAPMKKLISDEMTKKPKSRGNAPSIVARLMGVDTMPIDTKPVNDFYKEKLTRSSSASSTVSSKSIKQMNLDSFHLNEETDSDEWSVNTSSKKPMPREHPQEEELQKFKKEFEAWQTARFKECSKIVENVAVSDQFIAQQNLNKQKMALYANPVETHEDLRKSRSLKSDEKRSFFKRRETLSEDFDQYSAPTKIVILRPGFDNVSNSEEPWATSSSHASEDRNKIEDFLEEVKERLKLELQGKSVKRGGGIETPYSERLSDPKQIAQRIAKQVRESVTKDLGTNLLRSESTRSYQTNSPEFISRDTRKHLSERLRNVLKRESSSSHSHSIDETENDIQSKSFRCGPDDDHDDMILSPVNLVRSLSAPVSSGTSFGKLLLEDRHVVTGAHIRRKHEGNEKLLVKKERKDRFNLKEKVTNLKYNLSLRARLFGRIRKIHSANDQFRENDRCFVKDIMNGPTVMMNFPDRPENSTEVPPSPASVCSSIHEEYFRYCASPTTTPLDDNDMPQAFRDISSNLNELRKQLNELGKGRVYEESQIEEQPYDNEVDTVDLEDENEAYIQDLLVASGLYHNSFDKSLSKWDTFTKPITNTVFEQVESSQKHIVNSNKLSSTESDQRKIDHKVLLDLLNEVLSIVLARRKGTGIRPPHGDTLLDQVWGMLREYLHAYVDKSFYFFDTMVSRDLRSMPWMELANEEIDVVAKEVECQIFKDLMEETMRDMVRL
ncbi:hypothetical protein Lser_V15G12193 [Lactuca serriola]